MFRSLCATTTSVLTTVFTIVSFAETLYAGRRQTSARQPPSAASARQLTLFLDCQSCYADYLRSEVTFVDYVRDRTEADIHVLITRAETGAGGSEYTLQFMGARTFDGVNYTTRTVTLSSDTDDVIRRQLATAVRVGVLHYLARETLPAGLAVNVRTGTEEDRPRWLVIPGGTGCSASAGPRRSTAKRPAASASLEPTSAPTASHPTGRRPSV